MLLQSNLLEGSESTHADLLRVLLRLPFLLLRFFLLPGACLLHRLGMVCHQVEALHVHENSPVVWCAGGIQDTDDGERLVMRVSIHGAVSRVDLVAALEVCVPGRLDEAATPIIEGLLAAAPEAIRESKRVVLECARTMISDAQFEELVAVHAVKRQR